MTDETVFPETELSRRVASVCGALAEQDLDGIVIAVPENIYYLTGLDHWGFFACHLLLVTRDGEMTLVARTMERVTVENQVRNATFHGHADHEDVADTAVSTIRQLGLSGARLGLEMASLFLTPRIADRLREETPSAVWSDASGLVDTIRRVQSPLEMAYTRKAALAADAGILAAIDSIRDGVKDYEISAECHRAMILAGSEYPGFGPFIRPTRRLGEEHTTWRGDRFEHGDAVFLEIAAAYRKYQAPMGRLIYIGKAPPGAENAAALAIDGMAAIVDALKPGVSAGVAYTAWQAVARSAGLTTYDRHHCGYLVGIGFPPSWTGGSKVVGLAPDANFEIREGMVFHAHSWFTGTGRADYFISNTVMVTAAGCEILTAQTPQTLTVK